MKKFEGLWYSEPLMRVRTVVVGVWVLIFAAFRVSVSVAEEPVQETVKKADIPQKAVELSPCRDGRLGVKFLCDPDWELQTEEETMLIVISSDPAVTVTVARSKAPVVFVEQLTKESLKQMGQYADGFMTENVQFAKQKAVKVEGFAEAYPEIRLLDYYVVNDFKLFSVLFSVNPKEKWADYRPLIEKVVESFEFLEKTEDLYSVQKLLEPQKP